MQRSAMCIVVWLAIASVTWAQPGVDQHVKISILGPEGGAEMRVLSWESGLPSYVEIQSKGETPLIREVDKGLFLASEWEKTHVDREGWTHGKITLPGALGEGAQFAVRYLEAEGGVEYAVHSQQDPRGEIVGFAELPPDGQWTTPNWTIVIPIIIVLAAITGCYAAQSRAIRNCLESAGRACAPTGVEEARFRGICGMGSCYVRCFEPRR
ncbi:MAG: hypothetical protein GY716_00795 [bacterium]|nr:hypothetical protein [bacterium]